jgi:tRNA pseudouridine55 synthase
LANRASRGPGLDGILVVAKPPGPTSHDVVALVRRLAATRRVGHGGTLDPFASGVLPIFLGRATRIVEYHLADRKRYRATVCFGASSTTDDLEGELTPAAGAGPDREAVEMALEAFIGRITQRPPAYSAIKVAGRRAYALARAGRQVEIEPREVEIFELELIDWDARDAQRPIAIVDVECSAGTYVRALARDLGVAVGNAAYLGALERTASGPFLIADATPLDEVRELASDGPDALRSRLLAIDFGLDAFPVVPLEDPEVAAVARGQIIRPAAPVGELEADHVRLMARDGTLVAIATPRGGRLAPDKVFATIGRRDGDPRTPSHPRNQRPQAADADFASEFDPPTSVDPDPASPDDD